MKEYKAIASVYGMWCIVQTIGNNYFVVYGRTVLRCPSKVKAFKLLAFLSENDIDDGANYGSNEHIYQIQKVGAVA